MLTGFDDEEAHQIALMIDSKNVERKVVQAIYDEAKTMLRRDRPLQVLAKEKVGIQVF